MKYTFEKYEFSEKGRIFLGYHSVSALDNEEAKRFAQEKVGENITLVQIYVPQDSQ